MTAYAVMPLTDYESACDKIREKSGNNALIKSGEIASKVDEVYAKSTDDFWDIVQSNGKRVGYELAFKGWRTQELRPKYKVVPTDKRSGLSTFSANEILEKVEKEYFDFSNITPSATNDQEAWRYTFMGCTNLQIVEDIGMKAGRYYSTFQSCMNLHTIEKMRIAKDTQLNADTFYRCDSLANLTVEGVIGKQYFNVQYSPLTHDSLMSIINALADYSADTSGTDWLVTLGTANIAKLSEDELLTIESKGWRYS